MANVQLPDGSIVAFPDGMPDTAINKAIEDHLSPPVTNEGGQIISAGATPTNALSNYGNAARNGLTKSGNALFGIGIDAAAGVGALDPDVAQSAKDIISNADKISGKMNPTVPGLSSDLGDAIGGNPMAVTPGGPAMAGLASGAFAALKNTDPAASIEDKTGEAAGGGITGAITGKALNAVLAPAFKAISPRAQQMADYLKKSGVALTPAQITGSKTYKAMEGIFNNTPIASGIQAKATAGQAGQFTKAVLEKSGLTQADLDSAVASKLLPEGTTLANATRDVVGLGYSNAGKKIGDLTKPYTLNVDNQLYKDTMDTVDKYRLNVIDPFQKQSIHDIASEITANPNMTGEAYQNLRSTLGSMAHSANKANPQYASALSDLQGHLDDAMERSVPASVAPQLATARSQYGNMKTVMRAMNTGSEDALEGNISPARLGAAMRPGNATGFTTGRGNMNPLQEAGANFVKAPPTTHGDAESLGKIMAAFEALKHGAAGAAGLAAPLPITLALQQAYNRMPGYFVKGVPGGKEAAALLARGLGSEEGSAIAK